MDYLKMQCEKRLSEHMGEREVHTGVLVFHSPEGTVEVKEWVKALEDELLRWKNKHIERCGEINKLTQERDQSIQNAHEVSDDGAKAWRRVDQLLHENQECIGRIKSNVQHMTYIGNQNVEAERGFETAKKYMLNMLGVLQTSEKIDGRLIVHGGKKGAKVQVTCGCGQTHAFEVG